MSAVLVEEGPDQGAIWHFGQPSNEQKLLIAGKAWVNLSHRSVITVSGVDRLRWLHDITTQDLENIAPNIWKPVLILDALGHIKFQFDFVDDGQISWLVVDSPYKDELVAFLNTSVHMKKGCYPGQETVAKINNLGTPPRKMVLLHLDGLNVDLPKVGDKVFDGEREVGFIGTVIRHYELGPIGLAVVKKNVPIENILIVDGISASQEAINRL